MINDQLDYGFNLGDNDNPKGRAINRRVQFKTKQY